MQKLSAFVASLLWCVVSYGQSTNGEADATLKQISAACEDQATILAEARFSKWRNTRPDQAPQLNSETFAVVRKAMHAQCVSVQQVALLRLLKSSIPAHEAVRLNIDGEIAKQMSIIERTL